MQSKRKLIGNICFFAAVLGLTLYGIFHGEDLGAMAKALGEADVKWLIPGVILVLFFIWGESVILWYMMRSFGIRLRKRCCFLFSSVGFFFSCITPSATGGQPMQVYYMKKEKVPIPVAAVVLMIVTITYKFVLVAIGLAILCLGQGFLHHYLEEILPVFWLGLLLNIFCVSFMTVLVFHSGLTETILTKGMRLLEKFRIMRHREERLEKLRGSMDTYRKTAVYLRKHFRVILWVVLISFVQRFALFAVTWTVYLAFGLSGTAMWDVMILQAVISVSVDMLPLPGGMGISEALFLNIFRPVFGTVLLPAMILSRGLGYYSQLVISAFFTVIAQIYYSRKGQKEV